jgi:hypothetical protein
MVHLQPSYSIAFDVSLPSDTFRAPGRCGDGSIGPSADINQMGEMCPTIADFPESRFGSSAVQEEPASQITARRLTFKGGCIMSRLVTALSTAIIATALVGGAAFVPAPAEAAKMSAAEKAALKEKTADCNKQAKEQKLGFLKRHKFVKECVAKP